ncbi:hypothetical protein LOTGIDRAFT_222938 [Lottia gigantea]|uniref:Very-long-chain (3R)-3-hydroxyacyl-CoA dehydratase n=1 Tax=Lottia gigantea TaxID=225164 RepID=V3ZLG1_LOTGI|nr:hypothetical protein LOTGIDRAFT_222938 [Lottia gigantea]ESO83230.1 hypothetical protein LOTGIDRAFT_222938 [Lottia gigantea]
MAPNTQSKGQSVIIRLYLILYNVAQLAGWSFLMYKMVEVYLKQKSFNLIYKEVDYIVQIFQTAAILEVLHCAVGFVKSSVVLTAFQIASRVFLVWGIVYSVKEVQTSPAVPMFLFAWTVTEIIRYSFYFFSLVGSVPYILIWCRYTFFIILYPVGVLGELLSIWGAMPFVKKTNLYNLDLPNQYNVAFNFYFFLWFVIVMYIPVFPQLYMHMLRQRRKMVGGENTKLRQKAD